MPEVREEGEAIGELIPDVGEEQAAAAPRPYDHTVPARVQRGGQFVEGSSVFPSQHLHKIGVALTT